MSAFTRLWQTGLLLLIVGGVAALFIEIGLSLAATQRGATPVRTQQVSAGPYTLLVQLYKDPTEAGFALPFAIAPASPVTGTLVYEVTTVPRYDVSATAVRADLHPDPLVPNGVQGAAEISVQGDWSLDIVVHSPEGRYTTSVPIQAVAPPPIPGALAWLIGLLPLGGLLGFLILQRGRAPSALAVGSAAPDAA